MLRLPPQEMIYRDEICIRPMSPEDGKAIHLAVESSRDGLKQFMSWVHHKLTFEESSKIYANFYAKTLLGVEAHFVGFDLKSGEALFCTSLFPGSRLSPSALEVGYWVSSKHTGKGVGTLAAKIMTVLAFHYYHADRISASCNPQNAASIRVVQKCGYKKEGELRDYMEKPTEKMLESGYSPVRDASIFALVASDQNRLTWYKDLLDELSFVSYS